MEVIRATPRRSARAVDATWTRLSGSSIQVTGTSCTRNPLCSASSSSVSKNHSWSRMTLYDREMISRRGPRATVAPAASRDPTATSLWRLTKGAIRGSSASSPVDRSTSMYATIAASLSVHVARNARPRPFWSRRMARTPSNVAANVQAMV